MEKINILLVDDRSDGLVTLEAVLASPEYNLVKAASGREALSCLLDGDFAVILLDVQMPEMDGFETAAILKQREKCKYIPIIFVTAIFKDPFLVFKGYEAGAVDYLFKPFDPRILRSKVAVFAELYRKNKMLTEQGELLARSEESKRIIIESARDIIVTSNLQGTVTSLSPAFERLTGCAVGARMGGQWEKLFTSDDESLVQENFKRVLNGETILFKARIATAKGIVIWTEVSGMPLLQKGVSVGILMVIRDISERLEAERERTIRFALERSNAELEKFAHICSHDLQEPLRTISSLAYLLNERLEGRLDGESRSLLDGLRSGTSRMTNLIRDLLAYAKVGSSEFLITDVNAEKCFLGAVEALQGLIKETGAQVTHDGLPQVKGNANLLTQVFQNLLSNAIKFRTGEIPKIHVGVDLVDGQWRFSVKDNGIGFKMEYAEKIFQVFKRLHHADEYPGTGMGLGICKRIIEQMRGRIWAQSELGQGSVFYFILLASTKADKREVQKDFLRGRDKAVEVSAGASG